MTAHLRALCVDANDPLRLARFWAGVLDREMVDDPGAARPSRRATTPVSGSGSFRPGAEVRPEPGPPPPDELFPGDQQSTVDRAVHLGAMHLDVGQLPEEGHVVLADPEGNEFCVIEPGNTFLAGLRVPRRAGL